MFIISSKCDACSEKLIKRTASRMAEDGYLTAGYEYVIVDDCWSEWTRDNVTRRLVPDRKRFPSGMAHLADYVICMLFYYLFDLVGTLSVILLR